MISRSRGSVVGLRKVNGDKGRSGNYERLRVLEKHPDNSGTTATDCRCNVDDAMMNATNK